MNWCTSRIECPLQMLSSSTSVALITGMHRSAAWPMVQVSSPENKKDVPRTSPGHLNRKIGGPKDVRKSCFDVRGTFLGTSISSRGTILRMSLVRPRDIRGSPTDVRMSVGGCTADVRRTSVVHWDFSSLQSVAD